MKRAWICLDPGITTGWAVLNEKGEVMATSVWGTAEVKDTLDLLVRQVFSAGFTLNAVIERMPPGRFGELGKKLEAVRRDIAHIIDETYAIPTVYVLPGEWKPSRVAKTTKVPGQWKGTPLMVHQKDAIRMGRYVIDRQKGSEEW
jgi:hypothetical protein